MKQAVETTREHLTVSQDILVRMPEQHDDPAPFRARSCGSNGERLRVAHLSPSYGGVANAARQVHAGLLKIGVESRCFVTHPPHSEEPLQHIYGLPRFNRIVEMADHVSMRINSYVGLTGMIHLTSLFRSFPHFDVIHLHGMDSAWFNLHVLPRLDRHHVLVWTMYDKHLGTGACGYPEMWESCERWKNGCGHCPKVKAEGWWLDCTRLIYQRKKKIVKSTRMAIVAPNRWMFDFIASAPITGEQPLRHIPSGVDTDAFAPMPAESCREELKLPTRGNLLLTVASKLDAPRKGLQYYEPLLRHLKSECAQELGLVLVGARLSKDVLSRLQGIMPVYAMGKIDDLRTLAKAYSACDLTLVMSMIDNFPGVALESLACGTPVAAFRVGGLTDMVEPGQTGILSELEATDDLAGQISALLKEPSRLVAMRSHCRERAMRLYSHRVHGLKYLELYQDLQAARHATSA